MQQAPEVAKTKTDLAIIGFGMNDSVRLGVQTAENVQAIVEAIRAENPDCEFIMCSCIVPNRKSGYMFQPGAAARCVWSAGDRGVAAVDIYSTHEKIFADQGLYRLHGNNVNHPNDWLARMYAMHLLSALLTIRGHNKNRAAFAVPVFYGFWVSVCLRGNSDQGEYVVVLMRINVWVWDRWCPRVAR